MKLVIALVLTVGTIAGAASAAEARHSDDLPSKLCEIFPFYPGC